jgi:hypothetical protein
VREREREEINRCAQYKCDGLCESFVPVGLDQAPTSLSERTFVLVGGSNRYKFIHLYGWEKYPVQMKNQAWDIWVIL